DGNPVAERRSRRPVVLRALRGLPSGHRAVPPHARRAGGDLPAVPGADAALGGGRPDRRPAGFPPRAGLRHALPPAQAAHRRRAGHPAPPGRRRAVGVDPADRGRPGTQGPGLLGQRAHDRRPGTGPGRVRGTAEAAARDRRAGQLAACGRRPRRL
ncbi:MAG: Organic hydroperoxide resistance transcriptional regulator, partial [uncultured Blastococcus sp.]